MFTRNISAFIAILIFLLFQWPYSAIESETLPLKSHKFITAYDFDEADIPFIASRFDMIDTYLSKTKQIQEIKKLNPHFRAIYYKNALTHREEGIEDRCIPDAQTGSRLVNKDWGWYLMDIGSASYRTSLARRIKNDLDVNPIFDGVFLDDVWGSVSSERFYREGTKETGVLPRAVVSSWRENMRLLLKEIKIAIGRKLLIINTGAFNSDYVAISDGQMYEAFCHANWQPYGEYYSNWKSCLDKMIEISKSGKIYLAQSGTQKTSTETQTNKINRYCFAMFLLGADTNCYFYLSNNYRGVTYFPEWDFDMGSPVEDYHARAGMLLYERKYSKGLVLINPSLETVQVKLDGKFKDIDGLATDTITLGSNEGQILIEISDDTAPQRERSFNR